MEGRRIFGSKLFLAVLSGLMVLNCFFFIYQQSDGRQDIWAYGEAYHRQVEELSRLDWEEALAWSVNYQEDALDAMITGSWDFEGEAESLHSIAKQLQAQYEYLLGYEDYLDKIDADVKKLQAVSLFSKSGTAANQNVIKTGQDFSAMRAVKVTAGHDLAVSAFFEDRWPDYSILILMCVVCGLFVAERKEGLWPMIYAAPGGRGRLALKRIGILFLAAWLGSFLLVGSKILLCGWVFHGLGEWDRILQSISMFGNVPTPMTIGQFWLLYLAVKALGAFWIGLVLWAVLSAISNLGLALGTAGLLLGLEFACTTIPSSSMFAWLRYVNVFSYVDFGTVFTRYLNLSVFGSMISGSDLVLVMLPPLCVVFALLVVIITERKHPVSAVNRLLGWIDGIYKRLDPLVAGGGEARKLLVKRRGILLLVLLAVVVGRMEAPPREYVPWDPYIQHYQAKYAGPITEDTIDALEEELETSMDPGNREALGTILTAARTAPEGAWIVPTAPYDAIWSNNLQNYHRITALTALLFLVLVLAPIVSQEPHNDMILLLRSAPGGRQRLLLRKQMVLLLVTTVIWAMVYGTELVNTIQAYGAFQCLAAPVYSLELFRNWGLSLSLRGMMTLYYGAKLLVMVIAGEVCFLLSGRCSKNRNAILLCCGVILMPAALAAIGSEAGELLSFLLPLGGAELFWVLR